MSLATKFLQTIVASIAFIIVVGAQFILLIFRSIFPPKMQELIPLLEMNDTLLTQISLLFSDNERREAEKALSELEEVSDQMETVVKGYALRKGVGQSVDLAVSAVALSAFGIFQLIQQSSNPVLLLYLFGSATMALSTFAGFFGPPYALWQESKNFCLRHGNYRGAGIYKTLESIVALPFLSSAAGFLLLDMPPVDQESLEDFRKEMGEQMEEVTEKLSSLVGLDKSAVPQKTVKMISSMMAQNTETLETMDFRNLRQEKAREFALNYFQREFPLNPFARKKAVKEFAKRHHLTMEETEDTLRLITNKIRMGQEDEDLVNNIMITGALKGIIEKEQEYREEYGALELGQIATGLAFGARQFLEDKYTSISTREKIRDNLKGFAIFLIAMPWVITTTIIAYTNYFYDYWVGTFKDSKNINIWGSLKARYLEVHAEIAKVPANLRSKLSKKQQVAEITEGENEDTQVVESPSTRYSIKRILRKITNAFIAFLLIPFKVLFKISKWIYLKIIGEEIDARAKLAQEITGSALTSMYDELFDRLVQQSHVSSSF